MSRLSLRTFAPVLAALVLSIAPACAPAGDDPLDAEDAPFPDGKADGGIEAGSPEARAVLSLVNDPALTFEELDIDAALNALSARNIIDHLIGPDGARGTADDDSIDTLAELDDISWVGPYALSQLLDYAIAQGYMDESSGDADVVFSPQPYADSHNVRVAEVIDGAQHSLDIAMYSFSDAGISDAIERATARGVEVRFLFDTAYEDRRLEGDALLNTKSGRLERIGADVRWVNKIMHHKFMIVDGPRDEASRADTATVVSGSGNWSWGAASVYDENTLFLTGYRELTLRLQKEFNHLWAHSRPLDAVSMPYELSSLSIDDLGIEDDPDTHAYFTSENFTVSGDTFRIERGSDEIADSIVAAIRDADTSIAIASGHLRSRPISEALMEVAAARPDLDIRIYLDGQEYISSWYHNEQLQDLDDCLAEATTEIQEMDCMQSGFYFGYAVGQAGIDVRYKYYAYRWHYSYAEQMHHKYLIIDGDELWTGSYNLSDNAEHNTFENIMVFRGPEHADLVAAYEANFDALWNTGTTLYDDLLDDVATIDPIPLIFEPMALTWDQVSHLKDAIYANCDAINSYDYRRHPEDHRTCPR